MKTNTTYRMKDGSWQVIVSYKDGSRWRQKSRQGFATKREAREAEAELLSAIKERPRPVDEALKDITLIKFCEIYLRGKPALARSTRFHYADAVKSLQDVANMPVHTITYLHLQNAISGWNIAPGTQVLYRTKLNALFRAAIKPYRIIKDNPMEDVAIVRDRQKKAKRVLTGDEIRQVLATNDMALHILYYTGLRKGELLALTWSDVDWKHSTLTISRQFANTGKGEWGNVPLKSKNGYREIPLPAVLVRELKRWHDSAPMDMSRRLFPFPCYTYKSIQQKLKRIAGDLTPHCLRHTYATQLLARGMDLQTVAALLGDDVKTVIITYIHYSDEMRAAAARSIEKIFATNF